jgi:hypothetical protein
MKNQMSIRQRHLNVLSNLNQTKEIVELIRILEGMTDLEYEDEIRKGF